MSYVRPHEKLFGILRVSNPAARKDLDDRTWGGSGTNKKKTLSSELMVQIKLKGVIGVERLQEASGAV